MALWAGYPSPTAAELLLNNSWFSGFVDAEGSFCCYIKNGSTSTKLKFSILFDIAQKYYLNKVVLDKLIFIIWNR